MSKIINLSGDARREEAVQNYYIEPLTRYKVLKGRKIKSNAGGRDIVDEVYDFKFTDKKSGEKFIVQVGYPTAMKLCKRIKQDFGPLFNPIQGEYNAKEVPIFGKGGVGGNKVASKGHPEMLELISIYQLVISLLEVHEKSGLYDSLLKLQYAKDFRPFDKYVYGINQYLGSRNTTLPKLMDGHSKKYNEHFRPIHTSFIKIRKRLEDLRNSGDVKYKDMKINI